VSGRPAVQLEQAADVEIGAVAGGNIIHGLSPDRLADILERLLDSHSRMEMRMRAMEVAQGDYRFADAIERERGQRLAERRHEAEQGILLAGLDGIRHQIAEQDAALSALGAAQRRQIRRLAIALAAVALIIIGLLADRAWALWLAGAAATVAYYARSQ
jgi:hypothetical protein